MRKITQIGLPIIAVTIPVYAAIAGTALNAPGAVSGKLITAGATIGWVAVAGWLSVRYATMTRDWIGPKAGVAYASMARTAVMLTLLAVTLLVALALLRIAAGSLLIGGALTGIIIAAGLQQPLASLFAGIILMITRPFALGSRVKISSGNLGEFEGTIMEVGFVYVRFRADQRILYIPNTQMLGAVIEPQSPPDRPTRPMRRTSR